MYSKCQQNEKKHLFGFGLPSIRYHRFKHVEPVNKVCVLMSCLEIDVENPMKLHSVLQFRGLFNVSLSRAHYDTLFC